MIARAISCFFALIPSLLLGFDPSLPPNVAPDPGRLVGFGKVSEDLRVEDTLPQGSAAEGFIQVDAFGGNWIALRNDGTVAMGGRDPWAQDPVPTFEKKIKQVAIGSYWLVLFEDGTMAAGGGSAGHVKNGVRDLPPEAVGIVSVDLGSSYAIALSAQGRVYYWQQRRAQVEAFQALLAELPPDVVDIAACGRHRFALRHIDGRVSVFDRTKFQRVEDQEEQYRGAVQLAAGWNHLIGRDAEGNFLPRNDGSAKDLGPIVRVAAGGGQKLAQRADGTWVNWGGNVWEGEDEKRLQSLSAFSLSDFQGLLWGVGIEKPGGSGTKPAAPKPVPEAEAVVATFQEQRAAAEVPLDELRSRYFEALDRLAASDASAGLRAAIQEEKEHADDLARPGASHPAMARYQTAYRERLPSLLATKQEAERAALASALADLQELQNELTRTQRLEDAVAVRALREKLASDHQPRSSSTSSETGTASAFPAIDPKDHIFAWNDPPRRGKLVVVGDFYGNPSPFDSRYLRKYFVRVVAAHHNWMILEDSGEFRLGAAGTHMRLGRGFVPKELDRIGSVDFLDSLSGYLAYDVRGRFFGWGWTPYGQKPIEVGFPDWLEDVPQGQVRVKMQKGKEWQLQRILGVDRDGTLRAGGAFYEDPASPWKLPPNLGPVKRLIQGNEFDGVLLRDGRVVTWGTEPPKPPEDFNGLMTLRRSGNLVLGLRADGTLVLWNVDGKRPRPELRAIPPGLTDVVDLEFDAGLALALRADGTWVGWGSNEDGILDQLDQLKGCRQVSIGGPTSNRFILGIRPE